MQLSINIISVFWGLGGTILGVSLGVLVTVAILRGKTARLQSEQFQTQQQLDKLSVEQEQLEVVRRELLALNSGLEQKLLSQQNHYQEQIALLADAKKTLSSEFENLANRIFDEKQTKFSLQSKEALEVTLSPLRRDIGDFRKQVETSYDKENAERNKLVGQISELQKQTMQVSADALQLATALRGDNKAQGNWGEFILEKLLEDSGLTLAQQRESSLSEWRFKVFLDQREIGFHDFRVSTLGEQLRMETTAEFDVKILFFNAYRYRHRNVELWDSDCLTSLNSSTDANGDDFMISGAVNDGRFIVSDGDDTESLPPCIQSFAYWNPKFLDATNLLNSQTGKLESVSIDFEDEDVVQVNGTGINAHRYVIKAKDAAITLWYASADARWLALQSIDDNGRTIRYVPQAIPALEP